MIIFAQTLKNMTSFLTILLAFLQAFSIGAASKPVQTKHHMEQISADTVRLTFDLIIADSWHVYSTSLPDGGPISAELTFDESQGVTPASDLMFKGEEKTIFDQQTHLLGNVYPDGSGDHMFFGFFLLCFHVIPQTALCRPEADTSAL